MIVGSVRVRKLARIDRTQFRRRVPHPPGAPGLRPRGSLFEGTPPRASGGGFGAAAAPEKFTPTPSRCTQSPVVSAKRGRRPTRCRPAGIVASSATRYRASCRLVHASKARHRSDLAKPLCPSQTLAGTPSHLSSVVWEVRAEPRSDGETLPQAVAQAASTIWMGPQGPPPRASRRRSPIHG